MSINEAKQAEAIRTVNDMLAERGECPLSNSETVDWALTGEEADAELQVMVNDCVSERDSDRCEMKRNRGARFEEYDEQDAFNREAGYSS